MRWISIERCRDAQHVPASTSILSAGQAAAATALHVQWSHLVHNSRVGCDARRVAGRPASSVPFELWASVDCRTLGNRTDASRLSDVSRRRGSCARRLDSSRRYSVPRAGSCAFRRALGLSNSAECMRSRQLGLFNLRSLLHRFRPRRHLVTPEMADAVIESRFCGNGASDSAANAAMHAELWRAEREASVTELESNSGSQHVPLQFVRDGRCARMLNSVQTPLTVFLAAMRPAVPSPACRE